MRMIFHLLPFLSIVTALSSSSPGTLPPTFPSAKVIHHEDTWLGGEEARIPKSAARQETIELSLRSSEQSEFRTVLSISSRQWSDWMDKLEPATEGTLPPPPYSVMELSVSNPSGTPEIYRWAGSERIVSLGASKSSIGYQVPKAMANQITSLVSTLKQAHYGKAVEWPEASRLMPKGSVLTITDLETGLSFRGQRRAGSSHADVQPLTKEDTAIMKHIYGGKWSWNRKAVLVRSPAGLIAGSMHGMPHGGDGIADNDFNGHFCIHYKGSVTHGSGHSDPAHQAMIHKASGELEAYHRSLSPLEVIDLFLIASNQKDAHLIGLLTDPASSEAPKLLEEWLHPGLQASRRLGGDDKAPELPPSELRFVARTRISLWRTGARPQAIGLEWTLCRTSTDSPWIIEAIRPEAVIR